MPVSPSAPDSVAARRRVVVLGSTGSIGTSCLDVVASLPEHLELLGLSAHSNDEMLCRQTIQHRPRWVTVTDAETARRFDRSRLPPGTQLLSGEDGVATMVDTWIELMRPIRERDEATRARVKGAGIRAAPRQAQRAARGLHRPHRLRGGQPRRRAERGRPAARSGRGPGRGRPPARAPDPDRGALAGAPVLAGCRPVQVGAAPSGARSCR